MTIINTTTVVVTTAAELKTVLEGNNGYTYVYFGSNIALSAGIIISSTKTTVTIDGTYQGVTYTYTDSKSTDASLTISAQSANITKVTVKNITVAGNNYYGIIYVPEDNTFENIVIEYNNLTYTGPQITFHPTGLSRYIDCNITIKASTAPANEVAECNRIEIGGTTIIYHPTVSDSTFWYRGRTAPYFKVLENAKVTITSVNRELFYGVDNLTFQVLANAQLSLTSRWGMGYNNYATQNVLIDQNATFQLIQTGKNSTYATWYTNGSFVMNTNSTLRVISQDTTVTTGNYNICFTSATATLTLNSPKEVVLYNKTTETIHSNATINWAMTYARLNQWTQAKTLDTAGSITDIPNFSWYKKTGLSSMTGQLSPTATTVSTNNYTAAELQLLPAVTNFKFQSPVLSIGTSPLTADPFTTEDTILTGTTAASADLQITYLTNKTTAAATTTGTYTATISTTLALGTTITILSNVKNSFIYQTLETTVLAPGELTLVSAPDKIEFNLTPFSINPLLCPKTVPLIIVVKDTRVHSSNWTLTAQINHELENANQKVLTNSLLCTSVSPNITLSTTPQIVYQGQNNNHVEKTTTITWAVGEGIVLNLTNQTLENPSEYNCNITWNLNK